jgi:6-phosphogluconolactonase
MNGSQTDRETAPAPTKAPLGDAAHAADRAAWVYVANADSEEISVLRMDQASGELRAVETVPVGGAVMPMALSPDKRTLYAALRSQPYRVAGFSIDFDTGKLVKTSEAALADSMACIDVDRSGRWLFAASYGGHKISVNAIDADGRVGGVHQVIATGPNAHSIHVDASNRFVFATSLGSDALSSWRFDFRTGALSANEPPLIATRAGSGPRHFVWDATNARLYLLCELDASICVFDYDAANGRLREVQRCTTLPRGFTGKPWAADIHLSPDGRHLYTSERTSGTLAIFDVSASNGTLLNVGHVDTEKTPRGFAIDPTGRWLVASGQGSGAVTVYAIDAASGSLRAVNRLDVGKNPNWVEIVFPTPP